MTFDQLEYFIAIAETQNMTSASKRLNVAQPALSRTIGRLEQELDFPLFDRHGKTIILNSNGEEFLRFAQKCMQSFHNTKNSITSGGIKGTLKIGNMLENIEINRAIAEFAKQFPRVQLEVVRQPKTENLKAFDFFFGNADFENAHLSHSLDKVTLWHEPMGVLVSRNHPLSNRTEIDLKEAEDYSFVLPYDTAFAKFVNHFFKLADFVPKSTFKTNDQSMLVEIIRTMDYIALTPMYCNLYGDQDDFRILRLNNPEYIRQIYLYWDSNKTMTDSEKVFLDFVEQYEFEYNKIDI